MSLIAFYSACIILARFTAVGLLALALRLLRCGHDLSLEAREVWVIGFAGCMRGTIAYALILRSMPAQQVQKPQDTLLITTVLGIVLVNCAIFGGLFPMVLWLSGINSASSVPQHRLESAEVEQVGMTSGAGSDRFRLSRVNPERIRNTIHAAWHRIDDGFLKPVFRIPLARVEEEAQAASSLQSGELGQGIMPVDEQELPRPVQ